MKVEFDLDNSIDLDNQDDDAVSSPLKAPSKMGNSEVMLSARRQTEKPFKRPSLLQEEQAEQPTGLGIIPAKTQAYSSQIHIMDDSDDMVMISDESSTENNRNNKPQPRRQNSENTSAPLKNSSPSFKRSQTKTPSGQKSSNITWYQQPGPISPSKKKTDFSENFRKGILKQFPALNPVNPLDELQSSSPQVYQRKRTMTVTKNSEILLNFFNQIDNLMQTDNDQSPLKNQDSKKKEQIIEGSILKPPSFGIEGQTDPSQCNINLTNSQNFVQAATESKFVQALPKRMRKRLGQRLILSNTSSSEQRKVEPLLQQKHKKTNNFIDPVTRKVSYDVFKYSKDELFNNPPIFSEPLMRYQDVMVDPNDNLLMKQRHLHKEKKTVSDYERSLARFQKDQDEQATKNYWVQLRMLCRDANLRTDMLDKAEEFKSQRSIEDLKRCNFPFFFFEPEQIQELRRIGIESTNDTQRLMVREYLQDYEKLMTQFKIDNPHMFKKKEKFDFSAIKLTPLQKVDSILAKNGLIKLVSEYLPAVEIDMADELHKVIKKSRTKKNNTAMTYTALGQKLNADRLKQYMDHLDETKGAKPFVWNVQSFLDQRESKKQIETKRIENLMQKSPKPVNIFGERKNLASNNNNNQQDLLNWKINDLKKASNANRGRFKRCESATQQNRPFVIDGGPVCIPETQPHNSSQVAAIYVVEGDNNVEQIKDQNIKNINIQTSEQDLTGITELPMSSTHKSENKHLQRHQQQILKPCPSRNSALYTATTALIPASTSCQSAKNLAKQHKWQSTAQLYLQNCESQIYSFNQRSRMFSARQRPATQIQSSKGPHNNFMAVQQNNKNYGKGGGTVANSTTSNQMLNHQNHNLRLTPGYVDQSNRNKQFNRYRNKNKLFVQGKGIFEGLPSVIEKKIRFSNSSIASILDQL